jgi:hypothetical protein
MKETFNITELTRNELIEFIKVKYEPELAQLKESLKKRADYYKQVAELDRENKILTDRNIVLYNLSRKLLGGEVSSFMRGKFHEAIKGEAQSLYPLGGPPPDCRDCFTDGAWWVLSFLGTIKPTGNEGK